jgi:hypothetical protein
MPAAVNQCLQPASAQLTIDVHSKSRRLAPFGLFRSTTIRAVQASILAWWLQTINPMDIIGSSACPGPNLASKHDQFDMDNKSNRSGWLDC